MALADPAGRSGVRALLFERLTDEAPWEPAEPRPLREHDLQTGIASIAREVEHLLNTRRGPDSDGHGPPVPGRGYGVPDHVLDSPTSSRDRDRLIADIRAALLRFEPRLGAPQVTLLASHPERQAVTLEIAGTLQLGPRRVAVQFPVTVGPAPAEDEG